METPQPIPDPLPRDKARPVAGLYHVRLSIEGLKHQIMTCLVDHDDTLRASIEHELAAVVEHFDFGAVVRQEAQTCLREVVKAAVGSAIHRTLQEEDVQQTLRDRIARMLRGDWT